NSVWGNCRSLAMHSVRVRYRGRAAHAASAAFSGRSAADAATLLDIGVNYLREHMRPESRVHGSRVGSGGAPNVIEAEAEAWYYVRDPDPEAVAQLRERFDDIAR